ncbi:MAG: putative hydrolase [Candidatus Anoxychlamydiales bacterium]|nr:putative hydrolase [Candidatus Anoxychlamydiales bacterium]
MNIENLHKVVFEKFLKNKKYSLVTKEIDRFLDKYLDKFFYIPAIKELQKAIFENHYIAIFSSSPVFLVQPISEILKVNEFKATKYLIDQDDKFDKIEVIMNGKKKAKEAKGLMKRLNITKKKVSVYSDSIDDLELFEVAKKKVAVSPSSKLYKLAKKRNWQIL